MSALRQRDIARMLARRDDAESPPGLLERIKNEIPQELPSRLAGPAQVIPIAAHRRRRTGWMLAAAASVVAAIGAGIFALRVSQETQTLQEVAESQEPSRTARDEMESTDALAARPTPPASRPAPPSAPAPEVVGKEEKDQLRALGYIGGEPVQPVEIPEVEGVESGVAGGVPGGIVGGTPGGIPGGVVSEPAQKAVPKVEAAESLYIAPSAEERKRRAQEVAKSKSPALRQAAPSTGGTAEPNDQPVGDMFFESAGTNPFLDAEEDPLSTFALDVDTGSYTVVRRYLSDGHLPPAAAVRVEEMVNFFDYGDRPPSRGDFAVRIEGAPTPFAQGDRYRVLRVNLKGREVKAEQRKPTRVGTLQTIAKDAKVQVEFNPQAVMLYRLLGYENRDVADERFRDDSVAAGEIGAGYSVTALYEVKLQPDASPRAELATVRLRYFSIDKGRVEETEESIRLSSLAASWDTASPALRLASVVAEFAEILKGSYWAKDGDLDRLAVLAQKVSAEFAGRHRAADVAEFAALVGKVRSKK